MSTHFEYISQLFSVFDDHDTLILDKGISYSKSEILSLTNNIAQSILDHWIQPWSTVWILTSSYLAYITSFFGVLMAGCTVLIIDPYFESSIVQSQLKQCKCLFIITDRPIRYASKTQFWRRIVRYTKNIDLSFTTQTTQLNWNSLAKDHVNYSSLISIIHDSNTPCCLIPTWWTTWHPKIVIHSYSTFMNWIKRLKKLPIQWQRFLTDLPYLWVVAVLLWKTAVCTSRFKNLQEKQSFITSNKIDILFLPPCALYGSYQMPSNIKTILLWSAPIYTWFIKTLLSRTHKDMVLLWMYWMTECLPVSRYYLVDKIKKTKYDYLWEVFDDIIVDQTHDGELILQPATACRGYIWKNPSAMILTWDIVEYEWTSLYMLSRKKNMIIKQWVNIYPSLVEHLFTAFEGVQACAFFGVYDESIDDEKVVLAVHKSDIFTWDTHQKILSTTIHWNIWVDDVYYCDELPKTWRQNKIDYQVLQESYILQTQEKSWR